MRTLNVSLPKSPKKARSKQPPEELLQHFKSAALSVTNLYKTAAADSVRTREAGYQDALDDLLSFLDKENLGLDDGEGWKVRRWATERLDGSPPVQIGSDSDEERTDAEKRATSPAPAPERNSSPEGPVPAWEIKSKSSTRTEHHEPSADTSSPPPPAPVLVKPQGFTFLSAHPYPQEIDMQGSDMPSDLTTAPPTTPAVRFDVLPRSTRSSHKHNNNSGRHHTRSKLGSGAGTKRKIILPDFFDLGNLGEGKDGFGSNFKRGRLS